jgi:hypothetical protein
VFIARAWVCVAAAESTAEVPAASDSPTENEVQVRGTCRTPREAMLQLLYWIQDDDHRNDPARAAACFDDATAGTVETAERASQLKHEPPAPAIEYLWVNDDCSMQGGGYRDVPKDGSIASPR